MEGKPERKCWACCASLCEEARVCPTCQRSQNRKLEVFMLVLQAGATLATIAALLIVPLNYWQYSDAKQERILAQDAVAKAERALDKAKDAIDKAERATLGVQDAIREAGTAARQAKEAADYAKFVGAQVHQ